MSLLRFISRAAFASAFIVDGVNKVTKPAQTAPEAEAFTARAASTLQKVVPADYSSYIPEQSETWVRVAGGVQILGGAMFATGIGRRLGALLLAKASILNIAIAWPAKSSSAADKAAARPAVLNGVALLGASLLAAQDLQGKPSLSWRAAQASLKVGKTGKPKSDKQAVALTQELSRKARKAAKQAELQAARLAKQSGKNAQLLGQQLESVAN